MSSDTVAAQMARESLEALVAERKAALAARAALEAVAASEVALAEAEAALAAARAAERAKWREVQLAAWYGEAAKNAAAVVARAATEAAEAAWRAWMDAKRACRERRLAADDVRQD